jgi:endonuclease YncB( thermonuclease family)
MKKYFCSILVLLLLILAISCATPSPAPTPSSAPEAQITTTRVIDGDTIEVSLSGTIYKVRYIGMDAPELDNERPEFCALAQEATRLNRQLVEGKNVWLEKDVSETDKYGRLLRYVYVNVIFVNAELVRQGFAWAKAYEPDTKYQDYLEKLEAEAKEAGRGLWATAPPPPPPPTREAPNIQITYIFYDGLVPRVESDEYVEITNPGDQPQDLTGCVLMDISDGYPSFTFPSCILAPGESIRVYTNEYHPEWGGFSFEYSRAIWNNTEPDEAALYDGQGNEVSRKSY